MTVFVAAAVAGVLLALTGVYLSWTAGRIDRLHRRVETARASLDAQLVRRGAAALELATYALVHGQGDAAVERLHRTARAALTAEHGRREPAENDLSRALRGTVEELSRGPRDGLSGAGMVGRLVEVERAVTRVGLARQFHNDAVRDTRVVRARRIPRWLHLAGTAPLPDYFEIDDTGLPEGELTRGSTIGARPRAL